MSLSQRIDSARRSAELMIESIRKAPRPSMDILASAPGQQLGQRPDLAHAAEQLKHNIGWVYSAIRPIAQRIAQQPIRVGMIGGKRKRITKAPRSKMPSWIPADDDANFEQLNEHPILALLADPNPLMVPWSLLFMTVVSLELTGRAFWWVTDIGGKQGILPIPVHWIEGHDGDQRYDSWRIRPPGSAESKTIDASEMVYFHYPSAGDPKGCTSPLQAAAHAVTCDEAISAAQTAAMERGLHGTHVIKVAPEKVSSGPDRPRVLNLAQRQQLVATFLKLYQGVSKAGEPMILDALVESVTRLSLTPDEMNFLDSSNLTKARIMQGFGTNPIIAGEIEGANRASATVAEDHFCRYTLGPKCELISQTLTGWLAPMFAERGERLFIWIECPEARDTETELQRYQIGLQQGCISINEFRQYCGLPRIKNGDSANTPALAGSTPIEYE